MLSQWVLETSVTFQPPPASSDACHGLFACLFTDIIHEITIVSVFAVVLVVLTAFAHLEDAAEIVDDERVRTVAERDAFDHFADTIATVRDTTPVPSTGSSTTVPVTRPPSGKSTVLDAYRETVMAVPHYEEEYGEPLAVNMAAEFGDDVVTALTENDQVTPLVQQALVVKAHEARDRRAAFVDTLDAEATALQDGQATFTDLVCELRSKDCTPLPERSFEDLVETWHEVRALERRCTAYLEDRQQQIRENRMTYREFTSSESVSFYEYLYHPLDVTYPVLADGVGILQTLRTARSRVFTTLVHRG